MGDTPFSKILDANNKYIGQLKGNTHFSQGICPQYATGACTYPNYRGRTCWVGKPQCNMRSGWPNRLRQDAHRSRVGRRSSPGRG